MVACFHKITLVVSKNGMLVSLYSDKIQNCPAKNHLLGHVVKGNTFLFHLKTKVNEAIETDFQFSRWLLKIWLGMWKQFIQSSIIKSQAVYQDTRYEMLVSTKELRLKEPQISWWSQHKSQTNLVKAGGFGKNR